MDGDGTQVCGHSGLVMDPPMALLWTPYAHPMDPLWTPYGAPMVYLMDSSMNSPMDPTYGPLWTPLWTPYGPPMDPLMDLLLGPPLFVSSNRLVSF